MWVHDLLQPDGRDWRVQEVSRLFVSHLVERILATVPIHCSEDLRVWGSSCALMQLGALKGLFSHPPDRRLDAAWI